MLTFPSALFSTSELIITPIIFVRCRFEGLAPTGSLYRFAANRVTHASTDAPAEILPIIGVTTRRPHAAIMVAVFPS
jgi:hypothetical protein